ncbi:DUF3883 domain-containing protein [Anaeromicrobium sediminis]|uniref:Protein NO VEIN C-terminal domain-containing protein n=1 Tax=Anaeromicrobium sediminis TaxID=1478221 RepID=A0A267MP23_9FIRM|nr:DUF3883 domain-containing protein [Anaeromicrobium sediminis]PAB61351.1 hypothetical protein CCE28_02675 [Anaeromicrobium sediminis]
MNIHKSRHLFLKFNKNYENTKIDTMSEHIKIDKEEGCVIWGSFTKKLNENSFEKAKISKMDNQVLRGEPTFIFLYCMEEDNVFVADFIEWFSRYEIGVESDLINLVPQYYRDRVGVNPDPQKEKFTCKAYLKISNIRPIDFSTIEKLVNFNDHSIKISDRIEAKNRFSVSYVQMSDEQYKELKSEYNSYVSEAVEIVDNDILENKERAKIKMTGKQSDPPEKKGLKESKRLKKRIGQKRDYVKQAKSNQLIGDLGEKLVLDLVKEELVDNGYPDLAKKVKHTSKKDGDGLGYDILSYDTDGNKIYIEVKTTTKGINNHFYMSRDEREFARENKDSYMLYRVFNLDIENGVGEYYIIEGSLEDEYEFVAENYRVIR